MYLAAGRPGLAQARQALTLAPKVAEGLPRPPAIECFVRCEDGGIIVPRHWPGASGADADAGAGAGTHAPSAAWPRRGRLMETLHQTAAAAAVLKSLRACGGAVLQLPVGFGKTVTALHVAAALGRKTLVLVGKDFLARQWEERAAEVLPGRALSRIQGQTRDASGDVVVGMLQTLSGRQAFPPGFFEPFGLIIVDECHHIAAQTFAAALLRASVHGAWTLGLSATPARKDGLSDAVRWLLGPTAYRISPPASAHVAVHLRPYAAEYMLRPAPERFGRLDHAALVSALCTDGARTQVLVQTACEALADPGARLLVLSHRRRHCEDLACLLRARGHAVALKLGGASTSAKKLAAQQDQPPRVTVATYSLVAEGFDDPTLNCLLLATPAGDVVQAVGRVLRGPSAAPKAIYDLVDAWSVCYAQASKRKRLYSLRGFSVHGGGGGGAAPLKQWAFSDDA